MIYRVDGGYEGNHFVKLDNVEISADTDTVICGGNANLTINANTVITGQTAWRNCGLTVIRIDDENGVMLDDGEHMVLENFLKSVLPAYRGTKIQVEKMPYVNLIPDMNVFLFDGSPVRTPDLSELSDEEKATLRFALESENLEYSAVIPSFAYSDIQNLAGIEGQSNVVLKYLYQYMKNGKEYTGRFHVTLWNMDYLEDNNIDVQFSALYTMEDGTFYYGINGSDFTKGRVNRSEVFIVGYYEHISLPVLSEFTYIVSIPKDKYYGTLTQSDKAAYVEGVRYSFLFSADEKNFEGYSVNGQPLEDVVNDGTRCDYPGLYSDYSIQNALKYYYVQPTIIMKGVCADRINVGYYSTNSDFVKQEEMDWKFCYYKASVESDDIRRTNVLPDVVFLDDGDNYLSQEGRSFF